MPRKCRAFGKSCHECGERNHFKGSEMCQAHDRDRKVNVVETEQQDVEISTVHFNPKSPVEFHVGRILNEDETGQQNRAEIL